MEGDDLEDEPGGNNLAAMKSSEIPAIDRIMHVLGTLAPIEWGRLLPGKAQSNRFDYPPLVVWRFAEDPASRVDVKDIEEKIFRIITRFRGRVKWGIEKPGRNIVLTTARVLEFVESGRFGSDAEVLSVLAATEPRHANDAHADLAAILESLEALVNC